MNELSADFARLRIVFSGRVQGVGFRYTTHRIASDFPVNGYVRNLPNGTVEMIIHGTNTDIDCVLDDIHAAFPTNIDTVENQLDTSDKTYSNFEIVR